MSVFNNDGKRIGEEIQMAQDWQGRQQDVFFDYVILKVLLLLALLTLVCTNLLKSYI